MTHDLMLSKIYVVMYEVDGNTSNRGDNITIKSKLKRQTLQLTEFDQFRKRSDYVCYYFAGTNETKLWETGVDIFTTAEGEVSGNDYFEKTGGSGK